MGMEKVAMGVEKVAAGVPRLLQTLGGHRIIVNRGGERGEEKEVVDCLIICLITTATSLKAISRQGGCR